MVNIDEISAQLTRELCVEYLEKALPPKMLYRLRLSLKKLQPRSPVEAKKIEKILNTKLEDYYAIGTLQKNEAMASLYDNGLIKMDFGPNVSEKLKKAAMLWAKRRGLKPVEATLAKSSDAVYSVTFTPKTVSGFGICVKRIKWCEK